MTDVVLDLADVSKDYRGLRPLRIDRLTVAAGDAIAIVGFDQPAAEVFVNLVTGASVPDRGAITLFGRHTTAIADSTEWLALVDRIGIVTDRAVLLEGLSVVQNLAVPFTLQIEPPDEGVRRRAVQLAEEVELPPAVWDRPVGALDPAAAARVRLARALALDPALLLLEHATASVPAADVPAYAETIRAAAGRRRIAFVAATADERFASAVASRVLTLQPATGRLQERRRGWFGRR